MTDGADRRGVLAGLVLVGLGGCRPAPERRESSVEPHRPLWDWLIHSPTGRGRIRAGVPNGWTVAHKTGTGGTGQTNDIGYAYAAAELPVRIAVYYDAPESLPLERREAVVAEASRRALAALGHGRPDDAPAAARAAT